MHALQPQQPRVFGGGLAAGSSRRSTVLVQANKLIKGANRPQTRKGGSGSPTTGSAGGPKKKSQFIDLNVARLVNELDWLPERQIGPIEVAALPGKGRGVVSKEDAAPGWLLCVSQPIASVLTGAVGKQLQPQDLLQHWQQTGLSAADRFKLSLLHRPGSSQPPPAVSFKDFSSDKASSKAKKAAASSKGFGAAKAASSSGSSGGGGSSEAAASAELTQEQLAAVLSINAWGDDHVDGALALCRAQEQRSIIGVWPELALLNHSCAPNTVPPVLLGDRVLLRAAVGVPAGEELTTSYLDLAGGMPRAQRRQLLQSLYGFECGCHRCQAEGVASADVQAALQAMHDWASSVEVSALLQHMAANDRAAVQALHDKAASLVAQLEQQLEALSSSEPVAASWLKASGFATYAIHARTADWLSGLTDIAAAARLADLVRVFAPSSEPHLQLLADAAARSSEAAKRGTAVAPEDNAELRLQRFVRAVTLRYGEPRSLDVLAALAGAVPAGLGTHWLGLTDVDGSLGLDAIMRSGAGGGAAEDGGSGRRKVELNLSQLGGAMGLAEQQQQQQ